MPRKRTREKAVLVPDAELSVLKVLWEKGPAPIRDIAEILYPGGEAAHYATVQKLLDRLQDRGCVVRRREGRLNVYSATVERADLIQGRLRDAADKLCEGSLTPLLTHLVDPGRLTSEEIQTLRDLIARIDEGRS